MDFVEQVKSTVDIVQVIGERIRLKKAGPTRYTGLCPFHSEKSPSFSVNVPHQFYKCFGCGAGGDVFKFVMELDGLTFFEALKSLAQQHGIPIPKRKFSDPDTEKRDAVFRMNELAARTFRSNLLSPNGAEARAYAAKRGLTQSPVEVFEIGYAERGGQSLVRALEKEGFSPELLEQSGLVMKRQDGSGFFDRFRHRLMFPIHNEQGKVIAFGGRALSDDDEPKYLNSPETSLYIKQTVLYNLHRAKESMRREHFAVLVEGYMDVIGVYNAGVRQVVAPCGTAFTPAQVKAMKRHTENVVVNFDPDNAGAAAAERSIQVLLDEGMSVRIVTLDEGLDPDEFIGKFGADTYRQKLLDAPGYFTWLAGRARRKFDMRTADGRIAGLEFLLPAIQRIHDRIERAATVNEVADYLNIERGMVLEYFRKTAVDRQPAKSLQRTFVLQHSERVLLRSLLAGPDLRDILLPPLSASPTARGYTIAPVAAMVAKLHEKQREFSFTELETRLSDRDRDLLTFVIFADKSDEVFSLEQAQAWVSILQRDDHNVRISEARAKLKEAERSGDMAQALELMRELNGLVQGNRGYRCGN